MKIWLLIKKYLFWARYLLVQSVREASDVGRPAALQVGTPIQKSLVEVTQNMVNQLLKRNSNLPPTKAVEITNMVGCSAIK